MEKENKDLKDQVIEAENTLKKFISIRSAIPEYANALAPYQEEAKMVLKEINEDTIEELSPKILAPSLFIKEIEMENVHTSEGLSLWKEISPYYKEDEIMFGVSGEQFYFDESFGEKE